MMSRPAFVAPVCTVEEPTLAEVPACGWRSVTAVTVAGESWLTSAPTSSPLKSTPAWAPANVTVKTPGEPLTATADTSVVL